MLEKLGKFEVRRLLGQGAMGEVYLGMDPAIGREVAIKTILPTPSSGEEAKQRFEREARAAGVLNHPNLVTVFEFGEDQGILFIAMEYVKGHDLEELIRDQSLTRAEVLEVLAQVCDGLAHAHGHHIVHRDIKPSNIRVSREGRRLHAKVMDFGVARVANSDMTATGMVMGTVSYMAPEYIKSGKPDPRSDLFAVGVMLYEALSGRKPFAGDTTPTILYKIVNEAPEPIDPEKLHGLSPSVRSVLARALDKDPEARFRSADELAKALRAVKDPTFQGLADERTALVRPASAPSFPPVQPPPLPATTPGKSPRSSRGLLPLLVGSGALLFLVGGVGFVWSQRWKGRAKVQPAQPGSMEQGPDSARLLQAVPAEGGESSPRPLVEPGPKTSDRTPAPVKDASVPRPEMHPNEKRPGPIPAASQDSPFSPERLKKLEVPERKNLSNLTLSEAIQVVDSDPAKAVAGLRDAIEANPTNANAYAWLVVALYEQGRFREIPVVFTRARRHGVPRSAMAGNIRFRMLMQREALNRQIPDGED